MGCSQSKFLDDFANLVSAQAPMSSDPDDATLSKLNVYRNVTDEQWPAFLFMPDTEYTEDYESSETWEALMNGPAVRNVLKAFPHTVKSFAAPASGNQQAYLFEYDPRAKTASPRLSVTETGAGENEETSTSPRQGGVSFAEYESDDEGERKLVPRKQTPYPFAQETPYAVSHPASASTSVHPETVSPMSVSVFRSATPAVPQMGGSGKTMRQRLYMVASGLS